ncbi:MAG TPA: N-acetyltransferase family protein [Candidatus Wallbacteria bacterium]|nr:N-acetyltransferase family protein [Candidatus Wallbacteria bacterium]
MIRIVKNTDIQQICDIYNYYVVNTAITFEETPVSCDDMRARITSVSALFPWYVCEAEDGEITGYAYAAAWKLRSAYRFSAEATVYVKNNFTGKGIGSLLYSELLKELKKRSFHSVIGGIALPNEQSRKLHEKFGFKKVAQFHEVGNKFNGWIDVGYWQLLLK